MAKPVKKVEGVYEKVEGSGVWYTRLRVGGKLVRKAVGSRAEAIAYIEKARTIRRTGSGLLTSSAKTPARTLAELEKIGGTVLLSELCDDYLRHIQDPHNPSRPRDQVNPVARIGAIRAAFGHRPAASIAPHEIADWLRAQRNAPATMNRYKGVFSSIYRHAKERAKLQVNPVRDITQFRVTLGPPRYLKPDETARLYKVLQSWIDSCPAHHRLIRLLLECHPLEVDVAIGTGLRKGNQYALRWEWVDFDRRSINIPETKNGYAHTVPMIHRVFAALQSCVRYKPR